ncbi:MAG: peroxiredoxin family protein [Proteobacteria bacterium]|nr:peroxiredoxin family protein [Pseudomonadota bacterium]
MIKFFQLIVFVSLTGFSLAVMAAKALPEDTGLHLDSTVPEISVVDVHGQKQTIRALSGEQGLVLVFFRSADWCGYCKKHLLEINEWNARINSLGYKIAAISYDSVEILSLFSTKHQLQFPLLSDQQHKTIKAMNVLNLDVKPGSEHYGIPYPGVMIINADGKLIYNYFYQGYKKRVKLENLYQDLQLLE